MRCRSPHRLAELVAHRASYVRRGFQQRRHASQCRERSSSQQKTFRLRLCSGSLSREIVRLSRPGEQGLSESGISVALRSLARHKEVT